MNFRTETGTGENDGFTLIVDQIANRRGDPLFQSGRSGIRKRFGRSITQFKGDESRSSRNQAGGDRLAVICHAAGERVAVFENVEAVHVRRFGFLGAMLGESGDWLTSDRVQTEEIAVECQDAHRGAELHERLHTCAQHGFRSGSAAIGPCGFVLEQLSLRESGLHLAKQAQVSRGGRRTDHDAKASTSGFFGLGGDGSEQFVRLGPAKFLAHAKRLLRALRIVKIEY